MTITSDSDGSAVKQALERVELPYENLSDRFKVGSKDFSRQFSHIYNARLAQSRPRLIEVAKGRWGDIPVRTLADLAMENCGRSIVPGTLCKMMALKPSVLKELSEEHQLVPQPPAKHWASDDDPLVLEDETQRVKLTGNIPVRSLVTGIVMAVVGFENDDGTFDVEDYCFASPKPPMKCLEPLPQECYLAFISGLNMTTNSDLLSLRLLTDWLTGLSGNERDETLASQVVSVILAGGLIGTQKNAEGVQEIVEGAKLFDKFCYHLTVGFHIDKAGKISHVEFFQRSIPVDVVPGELDPTNHSLPQQPILPFVLKDTCGFRSLRLVTNPYECVLGGRRVLGTGGQPIDDLLKVTDDLDPLELMEATLTWGHLVPTAPDTLSCYPFYDKDPFLIEEQPDIYFVGNQAKYQTSLVARYSASFEGQLQKYTNVVKGWCPRWFFLDPSTGTLDYYLSDSEVGGKPRGTLQLFGAVISPSDEDSHTFTVSSSTGDFFKLRACDAKERQEWVNRLRAVGEKLEKTPRRRPPTWRTLATSPWDSYAASVFLPATNPTARVTDWANAHSEADEQLRLIGDLFDRVQREVDELPSGGEVTCSSKNMMELASTSLLTLHTLQDAIRLLENEAYRPAVLD